MRVLVLGGYGNFGARISRALAGNPGIELVVGGRDAARAQAFAAGLKSATGQAIDLHSPGFAKQLSAHQIGLVIHTAGPFQQQGYAVAKACSEAGAHYIDLADGRRFVCDFSAAMNVEFEAAGKVAITGASTVPALSAAVVHHLCEGWQGIRTIDYCIAPAQTAPRGIATMQAVLSYCGADIPVWREGQWQTAVGWGSPKRVDFHRLRSRIGAVCDIPDLELFQDYFQVSERVEFLAAVEIGFTQRVFALLATLRRMGLLHNPAALAGVLNSTAKWVDPLGSSLGGMVVRVAGTDQHGQAAKRAWHIAADHDHGPEIPCMAAILLARRLAHGEAMPAGARTSMGLLQLQEFTPEFAKWGMVTDVLDE